MRFIDILAQGFGIIGMILAIFSFQNKKNKGFFILQASSGFAFALNYFLIGVPNAALLNVLNVLRGVLYAKNKGERWRVILICVLYGLVTSYSVAFLVWGDWVQVFFALLTCSALLASSFAMWRGNGKHIRYVQVFYASPAWLIHNFVNFTLGGILCEVFSICSVLVSFLRFGKDGFEKGVTKQ